MEYLYAQDNLSLGQMAARWVAREILGPESSVGPSDGKYADWYVRISGTT